MDKNGNHFEEQMAKYKPRPEKDDWIRDAIVARADKLGLTAYAVAKHCEIDPSAVKRYFTGRCALNSRYVSSICEAVGLRLTNAKPKLTVKPRQEK